MLKENAVQIINSRSLLPETGQFQVKVTNVTPFERPSKQEGGDSILTAIVNYAAMTPYQFKVTKQLLRIAIEAEKANVVTAIAIIGGIEAEYTLEDIYQEASNQNLSSSQRIGQDFVPMKGEMVNVVLDIVKTENQPQGALLCVACQPLRTKSTNKVKISLEEEEENEEVDLTTNPKATEANIATKPEQPAEI